MEKEKFISTEREKEIEKIIARSAASMSFEGLHLTDDEKETMRRVLRGETTEEEEIQRIIDEMKEC